MTDEEKQRNINDTEERPGYEAVERLLAEKVSMARKEEVLEIYEELIQTIWNRIFPTLGRVTVAAIMERALVLTQETYPMVKHLTIKPEGVSFETLRQYISEEERGLIREALKELIANLIDILALLTGDILVRQLLKEIEGRTP